MGRVVSIVYTPRDTETRRPQDHYARVPADRVRLVEFQGIDGDAKGGSTQRQLNVMFAEVMDGLGAEGFKTGPGELGEQVDHSRTERDRTRGVETDRVVTDLTDAAVLVADEVAAAIGDR